jgi:hypothetical protein
VQRVVRSFSELSCVQMGCCLLERGCCFAGVRLLFFLGCGCCLLDRGCLRSGLRAESAECRSRSAESCRKGCLRVRLRSAVELSRVSVSQEWPGLPGMVCGARVGVGACAVCCGEPGVDTMAKALSVLIEWCLVLSD